MGNGLQQILVSLHEQLSGYFVLKTIYMYVFTYNIKNVYIYISLSYETYIVLKTDQNADLNDGLTRWYSF